MKEWNEITVMLNMTKEEAVRQLSRMGCTHEVTYQINDDYYLPHSANMDRDVLELLNEMVLIRSFNGKFKLTVKRKEFAPDGSITAQTNTDLPVESYDRAEAFLNALGYKKVIEIRDEACVMTKDGLGFVIEDVNDGTWLMLEIEENEHYPRIDDLKEKLKESGLIYDDSDYFVKKAQLVYNRIKETKPTEEAR